MAFRFISDGTLYNYHQKRYSFSYSISLKQKSAFFCLHVCEYWGFQENCRTELRLTSVSNHSSWEMRFRFGCRVECTIRCPDFLRQIQHQVILMKNELVSSSTTIYHCPTWNLPHSERTEFEKVLSHLYALDWLRDWMKKKVCLLRHNSFFILLFIVLSYLYSNVTIIQWFK